MQHGLIALDIDGTVALPGQAISTDVLNFLKKLATDGWTLVFITGRSFQFGYQVLNALNAPYYFIVQNGALTLEMPSKRIISKKYLDTAIISEMENICAGEPSHFVIYAGIEFDDHCYYQSKAFSPELRTYLQARTKKFQEIWHDVTSFDHIEIDSFASVKCFGELASAQRLAKRIEQQLGLHVPLIRDPFNMDYYVAQATHPESSKGDALEALKEMLKPKLTIAAGDDYNDRTMLEAADIKIVMETAPTDIKQMADIIAPSAEHDGIIAGLTTALNVAKI